MRSFLLLSLLLAACGEPDPCAGSNAAACIALRVEGSVARLDQLQVTIDRPTMLTRTTSDPSFSLPVQLALNLSAAPDATVQVSVVGLIAGQGVAEGSTGITVVGNRGHGTVVLQGAMGLDLAMLPDLAGPIVDAAPDLPGCVAQTVCSNGDGCCPTGCNAANDSDCTAVCGNSVVEPNEVCDDGNAVNGDGCDATCQWKGQLSRVAGHPGGQGHADDGNGQYVRLDGPAGLASTGGTLFVTGTDMVIRQISNQGSLAVTTTLVGKPYNSAGSVDGAFGTATFYYPDEIDAIGSTDLYVIDSFGSKVRHVDTNAKTVTTITGGGAGKITLTGPATAIGHFGANLLVVDNTGVLSWNGATQTNLIAAAALNAAGVHQNGGSCYDIACNGTTCYMACGTNVVSFPGAGGAVSSYAGTYAGAGNFTSGCADNATLTAATFSDAHRIDINVAGDVLVADAGCNTIRRINGTGVARLAGKTQMPGFTDGTFDNAQFGSLSGLAHEGATLFVSDSSNQTVRQLDTSVSTIAGLAHDGNGSAFSGTPVADPNFMTAMSGVVSDGTYVYGVDGNTRILKVAIADGSTVQLTPTLPGATGPLNGIVRIGSTLYVASSAQGYIVSCDSNGNGGSVYAGTPGTNSPAINGPRGGAVINPFRIAANSKQIFWTENSTVVRMLDTTTNMVSTLAGTDATTDMMDGTGTGAHFARAGALAADDTYLYVADGIFFSPGPPPTAIRRVEIATGVTVTIAGSADHVGHFDAVGLSARFAGIAGLAIDGPNLFVTEGGSFVVEELGIGPTVRQVHLADGVVSTLIGTPGQYSFRPDVGISARVHFPAAVTFDASKHAIYFWDQGEFVLGQIK
jgi:cysteine-rich repeat protein